LSIGGFSIEAWAEPAGDLKSLNLQSSICEVPVSEPQLRCLLCDLILADENARDQPTETCKQCGRKVLAGQTQDPPTDLQPLNPPPRPKPLDLDLDLLPEAAVVPPVPATVPPPVSPLEDDIPTAGVIGKAKRVGDDIPTVPTVPTIQPRRPTTTDPASVPYAAKRSAGPTFPPTDLPRPAGKNIPPFPARKPALPDPARPASASPRPQMVKALGVLGCMTVLAIAALAVIAFAILYGLRKAAKVEVQSPAPAAVVARVG
jgi:hypothetical protein